MTEADYQWPDLWCRRLALGLSGAQMGAILGIKQPNFSGMETGKRRVPPGAIAEIGEMERFVAEIATAAQDTSPDSDGVMVLTTYDDGPAFTAAYPVAAATADGRAGWPATLHRVAVGRAAATLAAAGHVVRIRVEEDDQ